MMVKNDWEWIKDHVRKEIASNSVLEEKVIQTSLSLDQVTELYAEGIEHGMEDGKYLSFTDWFHEFFEGGK